MKITVKRSLKPQATGITFALLTVVMISFGVMAEYHTQSPQPLLMHAQIMIHDATTQSGR
ncbi:MAG: hypothetical protein ACJAYW_001386 [Candidatus Azotimanducaceae bacterium]|jgi:hypothetical protein